MQLGYRAFLFVLLTAFFFQVKTGRNRNACKRMNIFCKKKKKSLKNESVSYTETKLTFTIMIKFGWNKPIGKYKNKNKH